MTNTINTINNNAAIIARAAATRFKDKVVFADKISKADPKDFAGKNGYAAGSTISISKPARPAVTQDSFDISGGAGDFVEEKVSLVLDKSATASMELTSNELAHDFNLDSIMERYVEPALDAIAANVEQRTLELMIDQTFNVVGSAGSTTFDTATMLASRTKLNQFLCPKDNNRTALLTSEAEESAVNARKGLFQSSSEIADQYKMGAMGKADGFMYYSNELLPTHTNGNDVTGVNVDGASQTGATLNVQGLTTTTGTVTKGSVFTIAGVNAVHPITKADTGRLQQFVVLADATADGSGDAALSIYPAITTSGTTQTVTAAPADTAAMTFVGAASTGYAQNLVFHKDAYRFVSVPLEMPTKAEFAAQKMVDGFNVAIIRDFDVTYRKFITRLDILYAVTPTRPEWGCRIFS